MMLTYGLPGKGMNGTFGIYAVAFDGSKHRTVLAIKDIISDNANRTKPFGTIDTPNQGGVVWGRPKFGWALTPLPKTIPKDGHTIMVYIDSVPVGHPTYNQFRQDLHDAYPDYNNSDGAAGFFHFDTTAYANGMTKSPGASADDEGAGTELDRDTSGCKT